MVDHELCKLFAIDQDNFQVINTGNVPRVVFLLIVIHGLQTFYTGYPQRTVVIVLNGKPFTKKRLRLSVWLVWLLR